MRLATYIDASGNTTVGVVEGSDALIVRSLPTDLSMRDLIEAGIEEVRRLAATAGDAVPLSDVRLLPPLEPASVRDFVAFEEHVEGVRQAVEGKAEVPEAWYDAPTFYFTNPHTVLGPGEPVGFPSASAARDFELEVAVVIGSAGSSLTLEEAESAIFGYTIMNDWSARDVQGREMQVGLGPAKGKDFGTSLGPWIVTADEMTPHLDDDGFLDLHCTAEVNGVVVGEDLLSNMAWTFPAMVSYASRDSRVRPGDVLGSGTVGHGGCLAELWGRRGRQDPPALQDGDRVDLHVQVIGTLSTTIATAPAPASLVAPRLREPDKARANAGFAP